jgi:general stress protein 26
LAFPVIHAGVSISFVNVANFTAPLTKVVTMDSINQQQTEDNKADLIAQEAIERIQDVVDKTQTCFFCTAFPTGESSAARPMNVRKVDDQGNLWFLSASDSHKNKELSLDPSVTLYFQASEHSGFMQLNGQASITSDQEKIDALWEPMIKTWFTGNKDDPRITVIKVTPSWGYYWDNKHGDAIAGFKMMIGAAIGKTMDDSIEGRLDPQGVSAPLLRERVAE